MYTVRAAMAHVGTNDIDHAALLGLQALAAGQGSGSGRLARELRQLDEALTPWSSQSTVAEFRDMHRDLMTTS